MDEIKYEDLLPHQQEAADIILRSDNATLTAKNIIVNWPRKSGKTFLMKYVEQELNKRDNNG